MTNMNIRNYKQIVCPVYHFYHFPVCQERSRDTMYTTIISILSNKRIYKTCA